MRQTTFSVLDGSRIAIQAGGGLSSPPGCVLLRVDGGEVVVLSPSDADRLAGALSEVAKAARHDVSAEHDRRILSSSQGVGPALEGASDDE